MNDAEHVARKLLGEPEFQVGDRVVVDSPDYLSYEGVIHEPSLLSDWYAVLLGDGHVRFAPKRKIRHLDE